MSLYSHQHVYERAVFEEVATFAYSEPRVCVDDSEGCLDLFWQGTTDFMPWNVAMDKTWIYHHTLESKL